MHKVNFSTLCSQQMSKEDIESIDYIENNPFYKNIGDSKVGIWIINNEKILKRTIRKAFGKMKFYPGNDKEYYNQKVDDCFQYILYYVLDRDKEFDKDFFSDKDLNLTKFNVWISDVNKMEQDLKEVEEEMEEELREFEEVIKENETYEDDEIYLDEPEEIEEKEEVEETNENGNVYDIKIYVLSLASKVSLGFYRDVSEERNTKRLSNEEKGDKYENTFNRQFEDENKISPSNKIGRSDFNLSPDTIIDFEDYDDMFEKALDIYDDEFKDRGLKGFKMKEFVYHMFLAGHSSDEERAIGMGMTLAEYSGRTQIFKAVVKGRTHKAKPDFKQILVENKYIKEEDIERIYEEFDKCRAEKLSCGLMIDKEAREKEIGRVLLEKEKEFRKALHNRYYPKYTGDVLEHKINRELKCLAEEEVKKCAENYSITDYIAEKGILNKNRLASAIRELETSTEYADLMLTIKTLVKAVDSGWSPKI